MRAKVFFISFLVLGVIGIGFTSCESCIGTERTISDLGLGDWDIDGDGQAGRSPAFRNLGDIKHSCNIGSHRCKNGIDANRDGWCDNCAINGYKCHITKHQPR